MNRSKGPGAKVSGPKKASVNGWKGAKETAISPLAGSPKGSRSWKGVSDHIRGPAAGHKGAKKGG